MSWNAVCDICGFIFKNDELQDRWDGFTVCAKDFETRHPMDFLKSTPDKSINPPWTNPEPDEVSVAPTYTYTPDSPPSGTFNQGL